MITAAAVLPNQARNAASSKFNVPAVYSRVRTKKATTASATNVPEANVPKEYVCVLAMDVR